MRRNVWRAGPDSNRHLSHCAYGRVSSTTNLPVSPPDGRRSWKLRLCRPLFFISLGPCHDGYVHITLLRQDIRYRTQKAVQKCSSIKITQSVFHNKTSHQWLRNHSVVRRETAALGIRQIITSEGRYIGSHLLTPHPYEFSNTSRAFSSMANATDCD